MKPYFEARWPRMLSSTFALSVCFSVALDFAPFARAGDQTIRVVTQFGLAYLPLIGMQHDHLWEKQAEPLGSDLKADYRQLGGGRTLNDALISALRILSPGASPPCWPLRTKPPRRSGSPVDNLCC